MRFGVVLGTQSGALAKLLPVFRAGLGGPVGSGAQPMSWIHIDDLVSMLVWALETRSARGMFNAVAPNPVSNAEFSKTLAHVLRRPSLMWVPGGVLKIALGEMSQVILQGARVLPARAKEEGFSFAYPDLEPALRNLIHPDQPGVKVLERLQRIPKSQEAVFPFFADAQNLEKLTPPFLKFKVLGTSTQEIQEGTLIRYRLKLHGLPISWCSRIEAWEPPHQFVDTQVTGPYKLWHHTHKLMPYLGGTLMQDRVRFSLPMGAVGRGLVGRFVQKDVQKIFDYRWDQVEALFGTAY